MTSGGGEKKARWKQQYSLEKQVEIYIISEIIFWYYNNII